MEITRSVMKYLTSKIISSELNVDVPPPAVVCYAADRNELRSRVIQWLQTEVIPDGWFAKGSNFSDILQKYFKVGFSSLWRFGQKEPQLSIRTVPVCNIFSLQISLFCLTCVGPKPKP